jgi:glycosyltransferase involved in cell wall biosynthesis
MSLGCPVLVNRTSSLPEVCGDAAFYFDSSDPEELSQRLQSIVEDKPGVANKRQLGERQVKLYDWNRCAHGTLAVYRQVTEEKL